MTDFDQRVREINKTGWRLLNCFQMKDGFRVNLQFHKPNGSSTDYFSEYADAETALEALDAAFKNAKARMPHIERTTAPPARAASRNTDKLTDKQEATLERAFKALHFAVKMNTNGRTGSED